MKAIVRWPKATTWILALVCTAAFLEMGHPALAEQDEAAAAQNQAAAQDQANKAEPSDQQAPTQDPQDKAPANDQADQSQAAKVDPQKERQAAQWALRMGGTAVVRTPDGKSHNLGGSNAQLPEGDLVVLAIDVSNAAEVKDEGLENLKGLSAIEDLRMANTNITDAGMPSLAGLKTIEALNLQNTKVGDSGVESLHEMASLAHLNLAGTAIGDGAITTISDLMELETLDISGTAVSSVNYLSGLEKLQRLNASNTQVTTLSLRQIKWLSLGGNPLGDRELARLSGLSALTHLELWRTGVNDDNAASLAAMSQLQHLNLAGTAISSAGLMKLRPLANLQSLDLTETQVDDSGIAALQSFPGLQTLSLAGTSITDRSLEQMANFRNKLRNLTHLYLFRTPITAQGLQHIATAAPNLVYLCLSNTQVGDRAVRYLRDLPHLSQIELYDTAMTPAAIAQLRKAMPQLQVLAGRF